MNKPVIDTSLIKRSHLFSALSESQLRRIAEATRILNVGEGEFLFAQGQTAEQFFLVVSGQIKLFRVSESGNEKIIELLGPKRLFAEAVMFMDRGRYPVSAMALEDTQLYAFRNQIYLGLLRESNALCMSLLADLSMRLHGLLNEIDQLTLQNATHRVVEYLLALMPDSRAESAVIDLAVPKQVIASRLSITPETFSRIMHTLVKEGMITVHGKTVGVHDAGRLRRFGHISQPSYTSLQK